VLNELHPQQNANVTPNEWNEFFLLSQEKESLELVSYGPGASDTPKNENEGYEKLGALVPTKVLKFLDDGINLPVVNDV